MPKLHTLVSLLKNANIALLVRLALRAALTLTNNFCNAMCFSVDGVIVQLNLEDQEPPLLGHLGPAVARLTGLTGELSISNA